MKAEEPHQERGLSDNDAVLFGLELPLEHWLREVREIEASSSPGIGSIGPYQVLGEIGRGGQGVVYRARQQGTKREIALKRLLEGSFAGPRARRRFEREIEAASSLAHPCIVTVHGVEVVDGLPVLAMEFVRGVPVTSWALGDGEARPKEEILQLFLMVFGAIQHAHNNGVLHRDLKPSNVLVDTAGRPRVLDFGLAKFVDDEEQTALSGSLFAGTPAYAAPEQLAEGAARADVRSDIYSLGVILYEVLTARRPFPDDLGPAGQISVREQEGFALPSELVAGLDREIDAIVLQALAANPEERYATVDALGKDVLHYLRGEPVLAHPPTNGYRLRKMVQRNRAAVGVASAFLLLLIAFAVVSTFQSVGLARQRDEAIDAKEEARRAELAAVREQERADIEARRALAVQEFLFEDLLDGNHPLRPDLSPGSTDRNPRISELVDRAAVRVGDRFAGDPITEARVRLLLADILSWQTRPHEFLAQAEAYLALADRVQLEPATVAGMRRMKGAFLATIGRMDEAMTELHAAMEYWRELDPQGSAWLRIAGPIVNAYSSWGLNEEAVEFAEHTLGIAEEEGASEHDTFALRIEKEHAAEQLRRGSLPNMEHLVQEARESHGEGSEKLLNALHLRAVGLVNRRMVDRAIADLEEALGIVERRYGAGSPVSVHLLMKNAQAHLVGRRYDEGSILLEDAIGVLRQSGQTETRDFILSLEMYAEFARQAGDVGAFLQRSRDMFEHSQTIDEGHPLALLARSLFVGALLYSDELDEAVAVVLEGVDLLAARSEASPMRIDDGLEQRTRDVYEGLRKGGDTILLGAFLEQLVPALQQIGEWPSEELSFYEDRLAALETP